jgi:hypothetical protein
MMASLWNVLTGAGWRALHNNQSSLESFVGRTPQGVAARKRQGRDCPTLLRQMRPRSNRFLGAATGIESWHNMLCLRRPVAIGADARRGARRFRRPISTIA